MNARPIIEVAAGSLIVVSCLWDVFSTILVPGPGGQRLGVAHRARQIGLPIARYLSRKRRTPGRRPGNAFGPFILILAFTSWILLLILGFGLLLHALGNELTPQLKTVDQAFYLAGSSVVTLGVSEIDAHGAARWVILTAGISGFGVITAVISFVTQLQAGLHQRETGVLTLCGMAGGPPSGLTLLENFAQLGMRRELAGFFLQWRDWSAAVLHSHVSYPVLAYFHSVDAESDWLQVLEALLDAATLIMAVTNDEAIGAASLMHRSGSRASAHLCRLFRLEPGSTEAPERSQLDDAARKLQALGYSVDLGDELIATKFAALRSDYSGRIRVLALHLGAANARNLA